MPRKSLQGFTLAELLIALAILGVIATFSIPKIINAQQDGRNNAICLEGAATMVQALHLYRLQNAVTASTTLNDMTQYINYVAVQTSGFIDDYQTGTSENCSTSTCLKLHNGAVVRWSTAATLGGTGTTDSLSFDFDPDGTYSGTTDGPGKGVQFFLYANGRIASYGTIASGTMANGSPREPEPTYDPPWFSW